MPTRLHGIGVLINTMATENNNNLPTISLSAENLSYRYKNKTESALDGVAVPLYSARCCGLLGPNGAGKTTFLSILSGLLPLQSGQLRFSGKTISQNELRSVSTIVPQDYAFYPALTGGENLDFFSGLYGLSGELKKTRIEHVIQICGLSEVINKKASDYSGGVKRRLNLAIGLLSDPEILYLDEPTVGIDAQSRRFILSAINDLKAQGKTIVYTSHYMEEIETVCDDIVIIDHGKLLLQKTLSDILGSDDDKLIKVQSIEPPSQDQIKQLNQFSITHSQGCDFTATIDSQSSSGVQTIFDAFEKSQLAVKNLRYGADRLEDVYLSLTQEKLRD